MKKSTKLILIILVIIILISLVFLIVKFLSKPEYTLKDITSLIKAPQFTDNMYVKIESISTNHPNNSNSGVILEEFYILGNKQYLTTKSNDNLTQAELIDYDSKTEIQIDYTYKKINYFNVLKSDNPIMQNITSSITSYIGILNTAKNYKYLGKETLNNIEYIKFSINNELTYYINSQTNYIDKIEAYEGENLVWTLNYTYSYNTVTEDNILKFDINNYPDYEYIDSTVF